MESLIYNNKTRKIILFDKNYDIIYDIINNDDMCIELINLPKNIFKNVGLYLDKNIYNYCLIDLKEIIDKLIGKKVFYYKKHQSYRNESGYHLYTYFENGKFLRLDHRLVNQRKRTLNSRIIYLLTINILKKHYNWKILNMYS